MLIILLIISIISITPQVFASIYDLKVELELNPLNPYTGEPVTITCKTDPNVSDRLLHIVITENIDTKNERTYRNPHSQTTYTFENEGECLVECVWYDDDEPDKKGVIITSYTIQVITASDELNGVGGTSEEPTETIKALIKDVKKLNGGCVDCTPPTLGFNTHGIKRVDDGVCINKSCVDGRFHTYLTEKTFLYWPNTISTKYYENHNPTNIKLTQLGIGVPEVGSPISQSQALIEVYLNRFSNDMYNPTIKEVKIIDPEGLLYFTIVTVELIPCMNGYTHTCLQTNYSFSYTKVPDSGILTSNAIDWNRNVINTYVLDGLIVQ